MPVHDDLGITPLKCPCCKIPMRLTCGSDLPPKQIGNCRCPNIRPVGQTSLISISSNSYIVEKLL